MSKYTGILHAYFYKVSGKTLKEMLHLDKRYKDSDTPPLVFHKETKELKGLWYQQFIDDNDFEILVNIETSDHVLAEEIAQCGLEDLCIVLDGDPIDGSCPDIVMNEWDTMQIPVPTLIQMTVDYWQDWEGDWDSLASFKIVKRADDVQN